jgi:hypothetical protein
MVNETSPYRIADIDGAERARADITVKVENESAQTEQKGSVAYSIFGSMMLCSTIQLLGCGVFV